MKVYISILFLMMVLTASAQEVGISNDQVFRDFSQKNEQLNEIIRVDISGITLYDFLNSIALEHKINISADSDLDQIIESSFFDIPVKDVFTFISKKYGLEVEIINDIIVFKKPESTPIQEPEVVENKIEASFNERNNFLTVKLTNDPLFKVAEKLTDLTGKTIILSPIVKDVPVSSYIVNRPFEQVIEMIARSNGLVATLDENDAFFIDKEVTGANTKGSGISSSRQKKSRLPKDSGAEISISDNGFINIKAYESSAAEIIYEVADLLNIEYFIYDEPSNLSTTIVASEITFDELLDQVFKGTTFTFKNSNGLYIIGNQNGEGLRSIELIQLKDRTVEMVLETLPTALLTDIETREVLELNGIMVSGSRPRINELKNYIQAIDRVVPMILIEVIIVQYQKSHDIQTGIKAGLSAEPRRQTKGTLFPTTDVELGASSINKLIDAFNGFGIFNLGRVTENFYLDLKFLENNSIINLQSTPKISTLNGHDATLSIGETNYYFEQNNRLINSGLGNDILQSGQWKPTEANLSLKIRPIVSKDEQITLTILVEKSSFLGRSGENAPPGKATQQFESLIRVKNGEMILLGGLDELERENSGTGTPLISRIPVLKWLFSSRANRRKKAKLHVFIKPTIVY